MCTLVFVWTCNNVSVCHVKIWSVSLVSKTKHEFLPSVLKGTLKRLKWWINLYWPIIFEISPVSYLNIAGLANSMGNVGQHFVLNLRAKISSAHSCQVTSRISKYLEFWSHWLNKVSWNMASCHHPKNSRNTWARKSGAPCWPALLQMYRVTLCERKHTIAWHLLPAPRGKVTAHAPQVCSNQNYLDYRPLTGYHRSRSAHVPACPLFRFCPSPCTS